MESNEKPSENMIHTVQDVRFDVMDESVTMEGMAKDMKLMSSFVHGIIRNNNMKKSLKYWTL